MESLLYHFLPSSSDETAATAESMLITFVVTGLAVASCVTSLFSSWALKGCLQPSLPESRFLVEY